MKYREFIVMFWVCVAFALVSFGWLIAALVLWDWQHAIVFGCGTLVGVLNAWTQRTLDRTKQIREQTALRLTKLRGAA